MPPHKQVVVAEQELDGCDCPPRREARNSSRLGGVSASRPATRRTICGAPAAKASAAPGSGVGRAERAAAAAGGADASWEPGAAARPAGRWRSTARPRPQGAAKRRILRMVIPIPVVKVLCCKGARQAQQRARRGSPRLARDRRRRGVVTMWVPVPKCSRAHLRARRVQRLASRYKSGGKPAGAAVGCPVAQESHEWSERLAPTSRRLRTVLSAYKSRARIMRGAKALERVRQGPARRERPRKGWRDLHGARESSAGRISLPFHL